MTANPRTGPEPNIKRRIVAIRAVTFEIHDGGIGALKACIEGRQGAETFSAFFSNAFVDENIRIDGEANPKHDASDARQCQCRAKKA